MPYSRSMIEPMSPTEGWGVLHLFCKVTPLAETDAILVAERLLVGPGHLVEAGAHQLVAAAILGHKADICLMALGPDMWRLRKFQTDIEAAGLAVVDSYLSLTEISEYARGLPEERRDQERKEGAATRRHRLHFPRDSAATPSRGACASAAPEGAAPRRRKPTGRRPPAN